MSDRLDRATALVETLLGPPPARPQVVHLLPLVDRIGFLAWQPWVLWTIFGREAEVVIVVPANLPAANAAVLEMVADHVRVVRCCDAELMALARLDLGVARAGTRTVVALAEAGLHGLQLDHIDRFDETRWFRPRSDRLAELDEGWRRLGLADERPMAALHIRTGGPNGREPFRDARAADYRPAVAALVARGWRVVRLGDTGMERLDEPGLVELPFIAAPDPAFDLWALARCRFFMGTFAGPYALAQALNVPSLLVNCLPNPHVVANANHRHAYKRFSDGGRLLGYGEAMASPLVDCTAAADYAAAGLGILDGEPGELAECALAMADGEGGADLPAMAEADARAHGLRAARGGLYPFFAPALRPARLSGPHARRYGDLNSAASSDQHSWST